jgi:hypothetical protein
MTSFQIGTAPIFQQNGDGEKGQYHYLSGFDNYVDLPSNLCLFLKLLYFLTVSIGNWFLYRHLLSLTSDRKHTGSASYSSIITVNIATYTAPSKYGTGRAFIIITKENYRLVTGMISR